MSKRWHYHPIVGLRGGTHTAFHQRTIMSRYASCRPERQHERLCVDTLSTTDPRKVTCRKCRTPRPGSKEFSLAVEWHERKEASLRRPFVPRRCQKCGGGLVVGAASRSCARCHLEWRTRR